MANTHFQRLFTEFINLFAFTAVSSPHNPVDSQEMSPEGDHSIGVLSRFASYSTRVCRFN